jgi:hypothetical protein
LTCLALSPLGERVDCPGVLFSRGRPGEGVVHQLIQCLFRDYLQLLIAECLALTSYCFLPTPYYPPPKSDT